MLKRLHNGHVLGVTAFVAPLVGFYSPRDMAVVLVLAALAGGGVQLLRGGPWPIFRHLPAVALAAIVIWAAVSVAWTTEPLGSAAHAVARLAGNLACGLVIVEIAVGLGDNERRILVRMMLTGFALALIILAWERAFDFPLRRLLPFRDETQIMVMQSFNRGLTVLALVAFPVVFALWRRSRTLALAAWAVTLGLLATMPSTAALLALAVGGVLAAITHAWPRTVLAATGTALVIATLVVPAAARFIPPAAEFPREATSLPASAHHRLIIWRFTADRIVERPLFGWGFDASRSIPGNDRILGHGLVALPLHPHHAALQWWLELGAVGALLGAVFLATMVRALRVISNRPERAAALALFVGASVIAFVSYGVWQGWWIATLSLSAAFLAGVCRRDQTPANPMFVNRQI